MSKMQGFFITGTDTDVGKTVAAAWAVLQLEGVYYKPVQSGTDEGMSDRETVADLTHFDETRILPSDVVLGPPLSPHEAARLEGVSLSLDDFRLPTTERPLVVEGAGGVLVPLNDEAMMIDLMAQFHLPVIVVARSGLGTINHTLLSLMALRNGGLTIAGVIMNGGDNPANQRAIEVYGQTRVLAVLPRFGALDKASLTATQPLIAPNQWDQPL